MTAATMTYTGTLVIEECYKCHIKFAMPRDLQRQARADSSIEFYCPLGHGQVYAKSEVQELQEKLAWAETRARWARDAQKAAEDQAQTAERRRRAAKGQLTKMRNRVQAGVCPVDGCKRHFANLSAHMETKHPGYAAETQADG